MIPAHVLAQRAVVRMLFDPAFAAAVRAQPDEVLAELPPPLRRMLAALDERALRTDPLRRKKALRTLAEEWRATTTWLLADTRRLQTLDDFFSSSLFHRCVAEREALPFAFARFLAEHAAARAGAPFLAPLLAIETALAHARRAPDDAPGHALPDDARHARLRRSAGVIPVTTTQGALAALHAAERYLFEVQLMPSVALCDDAPRLPADDPAFADATSLHLLAVKTRAATSLVTVDADLCGLLTLLPPPPQTRTLDAMRAEAALRRISHFDPLLRSAIADELIYVDEAGAA